MARKKLLFIDTNIWLDFYRSRNEAGLKLLEHVEAIANCIIVSYQLESEYKKNRQAAILEGMQDLKPVGSIPRPGIFSDAASGRVITKNIGETDKRVKLLKKRLIKALENPTQFDPVYQCCQRIFHKVDDLNLLRTDKRKHVVRRKAFRRFLHGCPPRKKNDTSFGDGFNWEWMLVCAEAHGADLVIVTRDSDYGVTHDSKSYINDHLRQEFSERISQSRKLLLFSRLSDALKLFAIPVTPEEKAIEDDFVISKGNRGAGDSERGNDLADLFMHQQDDGEWVSLAKIIERALRRGRPISDLLPNVDGMDVEDDGGRGEESQS